MLRSNTSESGKSLTAPGDKSPAAGKITDSRFRKLIENSHEGLRLLDEDLQFTYRSASAERILGWHENDRSIYTIDALVHPDDLERVKVVLNQVLVTPGLSKTIDFRSKHFDGHYIWLESTFTNHLEDRDIKAIVCNFRDITKQRRDEERLQQTIKELYAYKYALDESSIMSVTDQKGIIKHVNQNFCRISKYSKDELIGQDHRIINSGYHDKAFMRNLWVTIANGEIWKGEFKNKAKDDTYYWVDATIVPFLNERGKPYEYVAIRYDITERKNEELQKSLLSEIALIFSEDAELNQTLQMVLERLVEFTNCSLAEAWLIGVDKNKIQLSARFAGTETMQSFYNESAEIKSFVKGKGLPGIVWETQTVKFWSDVDKNKQFIRRAAAKKVGLKTVYGIPLKHNNEVVGVLMLGSIQSPEKLNDIDKLVETVGDYLGAEIKRKQLEQELNQIFNFAPDIICIAGVDGYFKKVNPAMCALLEYTEEELLSRPYVEFVHPDDRPPTVTEVSNIFAGDPAMNFENRYITKSGKIKVLSWTSTGASDDSLLFCVAKDITEKKELEDLFHKATTLARIGSWEIDILSRTVYWSEITRQLYEVEPGYHPDIDALVNFYKKGINREIMVRTMENAINDCTPGDVELQIVTEKGNARWVRVIVEAEFADGKCLRVYGSIQDIDVRKKAEIAGKVALEERNTILESIDDAFFAVDKNWKVTYWNNRAARLTQTPVSKILNRNLWKIFSDAVGSESYKKYHEAIETGKAVHFEDYYAPVDSWYEISAYPSKTGLSVYFKDITDRKISETRLKELNESLQKHAKELAISNAELEQFAYVASHDLQEPLRMVTSFMTQLEKKYGEVVDDKGRQYIHFAVDGAKRMRQIILDLLDFSRVGRTEDDLEEVDFNKLVNELLALYRRQIEEEYANIIFENLPTIKTYKTPIRQVFQNLVSNSLKYQKAAVPAVITVSCKETKTHYQFSVKDNGIGIAPEYFDKIFIIFQRLHNKDEYSGTGMGLAIAKKIVENLGGKIWVESKEGKGSVFYFTLLKNNKT
ncbi:MAG TPA: PAS domain S-box protein [Mucilaginibacter sp.]|nr:PAS domain S-box protein [Mucilaginibacter sp.]